jgi:hypothetical protein
MPGPLHHVGATAMCTHGAPVSIVSSNTRVLVSGMPVATIADTYTIAGCPFQIPAAPSPIPSPCIIVQWLVPATRVLVNGQPPILQTSSGLCISALGPPQGPPTVAVNQPRVIAT